MDSSSERPQLHSCRLLEPFRYEILEARGFEVAVAPGEIQGHEDRVFREDFGLGFHPDRHDHREALHEDQKEDRYDVTCLVHRQKGKQTA